MDKASKINIVQERLAAIGEYNSEAFKDDKNNMNILYKEI